MTRLTKGMALALCALLLTALLPTAALAVGIQSGALIPTVNDTTQTVGFADKEWYVIGYNGNGVYSTAGDNHVTLLAACVCQFKSTAKGLQKVQRHTNTEKQLLLLNNKELKHERGGLVHGGRGPHGRRHQSGAQVLHC